MPGARHLAVVLFAAIWIVSACVNVTPSAQTSPSLALTAAPVTSAPSVEPSVVEPTQTSEPTPTTPPTASKTPKPESRPNLVISNFVVEEDPVFVGNPATLTATLENTGSTDAGLFTAEIVLTQADQSDLVLESKVFENGLAAATRYS